MKSKIADDRPIAVYNCDKKELIGIFRTVTLTGRYLFPHYFGHKVRTIYYCILHKSNPRDTIFNFRVAVRRISREQEKLIGDADYIIVGNYPQPKQIQMNGFTSVRK